MASNPHDKLLKFTFSQVEHAADEFRTALPPALTARLDFTTLCVCPGSFVDEALRERFTDLLYSVELAGRPAFLYLLLEHQSTVDHMLVFRLWRYMGDIWQGYLKEHPAARQLPLIVPLVLHHSATGWTAPRAMRELFDLDAELEQAAGAYLPELRFVLDDLSAQDDEELRGRVMAALPRLVLWALKNARGGDEVLSAMQAWVAVVQEVVQTKGVAALATVLRYIVLVSEIEPADERPAPDSAAVPEPAFEPPAAPPVPAAATLAVTPEPTPVAAAPPPAMRAAKASTRLPRKASTRPAKSEPIPARSAETHSGIDYPAAERQSGPFDIYVTPIASR